MPQFSTISRDFCSCYCIHLVEEASYHFSCSCFIAFLYESRTSKFLFWSEKKTYPATAREVATPLKNATAVATNIYGHRVVTFRDFLRPCHLVVVNASQNIFAANKCPLRDLNAAKELIPKIHFFGFDLTLKFTENGPKPSQIGRQ